MSEQQLPSGYRRRSIQLLDVWRPLDWIVKVYGISSRPGGPGRDFIAAGRELSLRRLPHPGTGENRYGVALLIIEEGESANHVRVGWWIRKHHLKSYLYRSNPGRIDPSDFHESTQTGFSGSFWNLHVVHFERSAWIASVLDREAGPSLDEYLLQKLNGEV